MDGMHDVLRKLVRAEQWTAAEIERGLHLIDEHQAAELEQHHFITGQMAEPSPTIAPTTSVTSSVAPTVIHNAPQ